MPVIAGNPLLHNQKKVRRKRQSSQLETCDISSKPKATQKRTKNAENNSQSNLVDPETKILCSSVLQDILSTFKRIVALTLAISHRTGSRFTLDQLSKLTGIYDLNPEQLAIIKILLPELVDLDLNLSPISMASISISQLQPNDALGLSSSSSTLNTSSVESLQSIIAAGTTDPVNFNNNNLSKSNAFYTFEFLDHVVLPSLKTEDTEEFPDFDVTSPKKIKTPRKITKSKFASLANKRLHAFFESVKSWYDSYLSQKDEADSPVSLPFKEYLLEKGKEYLTSIESPLFSSSSSNDSRNTSHDLLLLEDKPNLEDLDKNENGNGNGNEEENRIPENPQKLVSHSQTLKSAFLSGASKLAGHILDLQSSPICTGQFSLGINDEQKIPDESFRIFPKKDAQYIEPDPVPESFWTPSMEAVLKIKHISRLYSHQCQAIKAIVKNNKNVIVSTATSSGKSMVFLLPFLRALEEDPNSKAIFMFPTKSLAADQCQGLREILRQIPKFSNHRIELFNGDTDPSDRRIIPQVATVIFVTPDILHCTILKNHHDWKHFFMNLKFIIVDEIHVYHGLFGSHTGLVMRRLRRLCAIKYQNDRIRFISCSATIGNPLNLFNEITGIPEDQCALIDQDGAPSGQKYFLLWNVKHGKKSKTVKVVDHIDQAINVFLFFVLRDVRTLMFCGSRAKCEEVRKRFIDKCRKNRAMDIIDQVESYRSGYTIEERRSIENRMFKGELKGIFATSALELGIDIGNLDVVIILGFPYHISNFRQQSGRAGRRKQDSMTIYIPLPKDLESYYTSNPKELFDSLPQDIIINPNSTLVMEPHVHCAAQEFPICKEKDSSFFSSCFNAELTMHSNWRNAYETSLDSLTYDFKTNLHFSQEIDPWSKVRLREIDRKISLVSKGSVQVIEEVEFNRLHFSIYEGGIFPRKGLTYEISDINLKDNIAVLSPINVDYYTKAKYIEWLTVEKIMKTLILANDCALVYGMSTHYFKTIGYTKFSEVTKNQDFIARPSPEVSAPTLSVTCQITFAMTEMLKLKNINIFKSLHAVEHIILAVAEGSSDISTNILQEVIASPCKIAELSMPTSRLGSSLIQLSFFERSLTTTAESTGMLSNLFKMFPRILDNAAEKTLKCGCRASRGCEKCLPIMPYRPGKCGYHNFNMNGARIILAYLNGKSIDLNTIPYEIDDAKVFRGRKLIEKSTTV